MPGPLESALGWAVHAGAQAGVLAVVVLLVTTAARGRLDPRWAYALWALVLVRLALPVAPPAPWGLAHVVGFRPAEVQVAGPPPDPLPVVTEPPTPVPVPGDTFSEPPPSVESPPPAVTEIVSEPAPTPWPVVLALGWLVGVVILLARQVSLHVRLARQRRAWTEPADPAVRHLFDRCRAELGIRRRVRLMVAPGRVGPATDGVFRPRVVLPAELVSAMSDDDLRLVLLHELAHVRRWDVLVDRLAALVAAVHWFNPAGWLALAGLRRARELACDAAVLGRLGPGAAGSYGHALLTVAARPAARPTAAVGILGTDRTLDRRIRMIARYRTPTAARRALGGLVFVLLAAVGLTDAGGRTSPAPSSDRPTPPAKDAPAKAVAVSGVCQDETGQPLAGVKVTLYRETYRELSREKLTDRESGPDGRFAFPDAPAPAAGRGLALVATRPGRQSLVWHLSAESIAKPLTLQMRPAAILQGRVTDPAGKPVAGARVWAQHLNSGPVDGVLSAVTDADGRYAITDMGRWGDDDTRPKPYGEGRAIVLSGCYFDVRHPDFGHERPMYNRMPATVDVTLQPAGVIDGTVTDRVTGKPAAGVVVALQGIKGGNSFNQVVTDADGKYQIRCLKAGQYNLWADAPDRACPAIDSLTVVAGKTLGGQDLGLVEGSWVEGQIVDAATGAPIGSAPGNPLQVAFYGPARPKSGAGCQTATVDADGRFRHRVPAGKQFMYIFQGDYWARTQRREYFDAGVEVKADEIVRVVFRVLPAKPLPDPDPTPVRQAIPVAAERAAAARVRELGGWYQVDADGHVVEVNMVYHETPGKRRFDNPRQDTDEGLRAVAAFSRLKRLMLAKGQATDDGLKAIAGLSELEAIHVFGPSPVTAAGIKHLAGLPKLTEVHIGNADLGDEALAALAGLPGVERLKVYGNAFTDDGLKHLAGMKHLRHLALAMNKKPLTEAGLRHLAGLTSLTHLDLQVVRLTDAAVAALKDLKELRTLWLGSENDLLTDASADVLAGLPKLQRVIVRSSRFTADGVERLLKLPELKDLSVTTAGIPAARQEALRKDRRLRLIDNGPPAK